MVVQGLIHFTRMILQLLDENKIATSYGCFKLITCISVILLYRILLYHFIEMNENTL